LFVTNQCKTIALSTYDVEPTQTIKKSTVESTLKNFIRKLILIIRNFSRQHSIHSKDDSHIVVHHMPSNNNSGLLLLRQYSLSTVSSIPEISHSVLMNIAPLP